MIFKFWSFIFKFLGIIFILLIIGFLLYSNIPAVQEEINNILGIPDFISNWLT